MIKKLIYLSPLILLTSAALHIDSNSAPASTTGAPGEVNCTTAGCHQSFVVNNGPGDVSINFENGVTTYTPGKTYIVNVEVTQTNLIRFGFQLVALKSKDNSNAGILSIIDGSRNQIVSGYGNMADRKYMTYTFKSTSAQATGKGMWSFKWTAPTTDEGPINFYIASIAANNDGNDLGDYCYTKTLLINSDVKSGNNSDFRVNIFPNPVKDKLNVNYNTPTAGNVQIELVDMQGRVVEELFSAMQNSGNYQLSLPLIKAHKNGIYFLRFTYNNKNSVQKIFIAN